MSGTLVPSTFPGGELAAPSDAAPTWGPPPAAATGGGVNLGRYVSALKRYKWLIIITTLVGTAAGFGVSRFIDPTYEVNGTIWVTERMGLQKGGTGPITAPAVMDAQAYQELLTSFAILDPVVGELGLYLNPKEEKDSVIFRGFHPAANLQTSDYTLEIDPTGKRFTLSWSGNGQQRGTVDQVKQRGLVGDSIGRVVGFEWAPSAAVLGRDRKIKFEVSTPREASVELRKKLQVSLPLTSNFMRLALTGPSPVKLTRTLNLLTDHFLATAEGLKKRNLTEFRQTLEEQLDVAQKSLRSAELGLEAFKYNSITKPSDNLVVQGGTSVSMTPAMQDYFNQRVVANSVQRDREALAEILADAKDGRITTERLLSVPGVLAASPDLKNALTELSTEQSKLRAMRLTFTDEHPQVKSELRRIETLETQTIPNLTRTVLAQLAAQESDLNKRLTGASREIREIPARTIEEQRLTREVQVANALYTTLKQNYQEAKLAEASAVSDVALLDSATVPANPTSNTLPGIMAMAVGISLGLGLLLALLLDHLDKRFRYPEQATGELGLDILGGVPTIHRGRGGEMRIEDASQLVEAFRALRLNARNACADTGPVSLTVTSPGAGDGKSTIASNLALSFAEAGYRTLLVDGDVRRGRLHEMFGVDQRPGLIDCLTGEASPDETIRETAHANMFLLPCGTRRHRAPELLASDVASRFVRSLKNRFDAVIVDTAPLGAGIDPFAIGTATTNMVIVLRSGKTDRKLAAAKLATLDRLPVRVIGAVLNDITPDGMYKYYSYLDGYGTVGDGADEETAAIGAGDDDGHGNGNGDGTAVVTR